MRILPFLYSAIIFASLSLQAVAEEFISDVLPSEKLPVEAQKMLDDLGSPEVQQLNNDKELRCINGGTKKITVSLLEDATVFGAEYNNCRESGLTRDGYFEVIVRNGEIVGESSRRSVNGELFDAVQEGNVASVKALIKKKADVNYTESIPTSDGGYIHEWTPLMTATVAGNADMVKLLIEAGAWVNFMNSHVVNALWLATTSGNAAVVKLLVDSKAYVNNRSVEEVTPLMNAAMNGYYKIAEYLIDAKAEINLVHKDGDSALMFALANGHNDLAELLVNSGANVNTQNKFGVTPLIIASAEGNEQMVRLLVKRKANVSAKTEAGKTALDIAVAKGNENIINLLR